MGNISIYNDKIAFDWFIIYLYINHIFNPDKNLYRFFIGFKLIVTEEKVSLDSMKKSAFLTFKEFLNEVNHTLMNDFISMPDDEINRYMKMEKLLENKISRRFKFRRLDKNDFGYLSGYGKSGQS